MRFIRGGQDVELKIGKAQALLAYLAVTGEAQAREHLLDLLWAESHPDAARKNLRNILWRMRRQLGDDILVAEDDWVLLSSGVLTDVARFESQIHDALNIANHPGIRPEDSQLESTLDLWRGPLLDGLKLSDAPDFELWLTAQRNRLGQLYLAGLNRLLTRHREAADWRAIIPVAQRALAFDLAQEPIAAVLMEAYARLGQRRDALRQYDTLRTVLRQELGAAPLPATQALQSQILSGELSVADSPLIDIQPSPLVTPRPRAHPQLRRPFVGRRFERAALDDAKESTAGGRLQIVLITGDLGIGKSTLWQQWSHDQTGETMVLEARCLSSTQTLPFAPISSLFGTQICMEWLTGPQAGISPVWLTELTRLLPQIHDARSDLPAAIPVPPEEERRRLFEALTQIVHSFRARPLILFIDDLHWADQATLDWLVYLSDRMREDPVLLVCAYRSNEASNTLDHRLARWRRDGLVKSLSLLPLSVDESTELISALDGNVAMIDFLHAQSGGNPYYLTELSRVHPDGMPAALKDLLKARLHGLPDNALRLLQAAAILEPSIEFGMLQWISRQGEDETLDALDVLLEAAILVEHGDTYAFAHPILAGIVRDELSSPRRKRLHHRVAERLTATHEGEIEPIAGQLTRHFAGAGEEIEAARYAEMAASRAAQMGAMAEAVNFYRQAYALEPTVSRQLELGYALMHVPGGVTEARRAMQEALDVSESQHDQQGIVQAGLRLAFSYLSTEEGEQVLLWADRILAASEEIQEAAGSDSIELRATIEYLMAAGKFNMPNGIAEADGHYGEATRLVTEHQLDSGIAMQSWFGWGNLSVQCGDYQSAISKFERTLDLARSTRNIYFEALCYNNLAYATLLAGDLPAARATIDRGLNFINDNALLRPRQYHYSTRGEVALAEGDLADADSWFNRALDEARSFGNETFAINIRANLGRVAQARGDYEQAEQLLTAAFNDIAPGSALYLRSQIQLWLAEFYLEHEDVSAAGIHLDAARQRSAGSRRMALQAAADQIAERIAT